MQIPAIKSASEMGFQVHVTDINTEAPGIKYADSFAKVDLKDRDAIAEEALRLKNDGGLSAVFTAGTDFSASVALAAEKTRLTGTGYDVACRASNKALMRQTFYDAGVSSPQFRSVKDIETAREAVKQIGVPLVFKPVDSMGARGVVKITDADDMQALETAFENAVSSSLSGEVIIEEYMDGPEFSLDALVYDGEITICGFADRHIFFPPFFIEMGHTMPTICPDDVCRNVTEVFKAGIKALGIINGAAKGDIKYSSKKGAMVGEIANRLSGGFMSGWTFPYSSGINLTAAAIRIAAGEHPGNLEPLYKRVSAERAAISIPGIISSIEGEQEALSVEGVKDVFIARRKGERVIFPMNNVQKCANCISALENYDAAVQAAETAVRKLFFRLEPGDSETRDFIYGSSWSWVPDAFSLTNEKNLRTVKLSGMPDLSMETCRDWHGTMIGDAFSRLKEICSPSDDELDPDFWRCFLRGGIQGGVWAIDTKRDIVRNR